MKVIVSTGICLLLVMMLSCGSDEETIEIGTINLKVDKTDALASSDTITITAEVLDPLSGRIDDVPLTYWADEVQLPSNLFIPTESGTYILTARYKDVKSKVAKVKVISLDDPIDDLKLKYNGVPYLTTHPWSVSARFDRQVRVGVAVFDIDNNTIPLYVNGQQVFENRGLHFDEPGEYTFYAELNGQRSNEVTIEVRAAKELPLREIPIIFHTYGFDPDPVKISGLIDYLNDIFNPAAFDVNQVAVGSVNANAVNQYIRFKTVEQAPAGFELGGPSWQVVPTTVSERLAPTAADMYTALGLYNWDPEKYINIWIFDGDQLTDEDFSDFFVRKGRGFYTTPILKEGELGGLRTFPGSGTDPNSFIGVNAGSVLEEHPDYVLTMIGHYLGLFDTYEFECIVEGDFCGDTNTITTAPNNIVTPTGQMYDCDEYFYFTNNFMSINLNYTNFTYDQRDRMHTVLSSGYGRPAGL